jgi:hypothetical protein
MGYFEVSTTAEIKRIHFKQIHFKLNQVRLKGRKKIGRIEAFLLIGNFWSSSAFPCLRVKTSQCTVIQSLNFSTLVPRNRFLGLNVYKFGLIKRGWGSECDV